MIIDTDEYRKNAEYLLKRGIINKKQFDENAVNIGTFELAMQLMDSTIKMLKSDEMEKAAIKN